VNRYLLKIASSSYLEGPSSTVTHLGKTYLVDDLIQRSLSSPVVRLPVKDLAWVFSYDTPRPERVLEADPSTPILVTKAQGRLVVIDGLHRLKKAQSLGHTDIAARVLDLPSSTS
jgi:ParB-like nuclease domain